MTPPLAQTQCPIVLRRNRQDIRCPNQITPGDDRCKRHGGIDHSRDLITHRSIQEIT